MVDCNAKERIQGLMLAFAAGDALGAPLAGLPAECGNHKFEPIRGFITNPAHPYFGRLGSGCYTENTRLLLDSARDYAASGTFKRNQRVNTLRCWANRIKADPGGARWPGETTLSGALRLLDGAQARSRTRDSVGATYRCFPIAVVADGATLRSMVQQEVELTHSHPDCIISAVLLTSIVRQLLLGVPWEVATRSSLQEMREQHCTSPLLKRCQLAVSEVSSELDLRVEFGTGARCWETIPLSLAITSRFKTSSTEALLYAANCAKPNYSGSWDETTARRNGGNSDGIAAIVGALLGAIYCGPAILKAWPDIENASEILGIADNLSATLRPPPQRLDASAGRP